MLIHVVVAIQDELVPQIFNVFSRTFIRQSEMKAIAQALLVFEMLKFQTKMSYVVNTIATDVLMTHGQSIKNSYIDPLCPV